MSSGPSNRDIRNVETAIHDPHAAAERFSPDFVLMMQCSLCGKVGYAPRKEISNAMRAHIEEDCPMKHRASDGPVSIRVYYPKQ